MQGIEWVEHLLHSRSELTAFNADGQRGMSVEQPIDETFEPIITS